MTESPKLLPCPWCKSSARLLGGGQPLTDEDGQATTATAVACNNDQCQATGPFLASAEQAEEAWNRMCSMVSEVNAMARVCEAARDMRDLYAYDISEAMRDALADLERARKGTT